MQRNYKPFFFLLLWYIIAILSLVQLRSASAQEATPPAPASETDILAAQVELMRSYNQGLLDTVYWSLGVIVTLMILIVAYNWYTNNRIFEREKAAIKNELELLIRSELKEESGKIFSGLSEDLDKKFNDMRAKFDWRLRSVAMKTQRLYANAVNEEAKEWEERESFFVAFLLYLDTLNRTEVFDDKLISEALDNIIRSIRNMKANREEDLGSRELARLKRIMENLPEKYSDSIRKIYKALEEPPPPPPYQATSVG